MGHEVHHVVVSKVAACFAVADLEVAYPHHQPQSAAQRELEAVSLVEGFLQEQVDTDVHAEASHLPVFVCAHASQTNL